MALTVNSDYFTKQNLLVFIVEMDYVLCEMERDERKDRQKMDTITRSFVCAFVSVRVMKNVR
jgi:hypothetical protein